MAVPAILGLAALGGMVSKLIEKLFDFAFSKLARKIAVFTVFIGGLYAAISLLLSFVSSQLKPLLSALPQEVVGTIGAALPSNTMACLSAVAATHVACLTYKLTVKSLEVQSKVV